MDVKNTVLDRGKSIPGDTRVDTAASDYKIEELSERRKSEMQNNRYRRDPLSPDFLRISPQKHVLDNITASIDMDKIRVIIKNQEKELNLPTSPTKKLSMGADSEVSSKHSKSKVPGPRLEKSSNSSKSKATSQRDAAASKKVRKEASATVKLKGSGLNSQRSRKSSDTLNLFGKVSSSKSSVSKRKVIMRSHSPPRIKEDKIDLKPDFHIYQNFNDFIRKKISEDEESITIRAANSFDKLYQNKMTPKKSSNTKKNKNQLQGQPATSRSNLAAYPWASVKDKKAKTQAGARKKPEANRRSSDLVIYPSTLARSVSLGQIYDNIIANGRSPKRMSQKQKYFSP